jgi:2-polyprenyl-6-methoxyphenol hydroxylase-like FAD-dependent oxidoreductase
VSVLRPGTFVGIWRIGGGRVTWFAEQPARRPGDGARLLADLARDEDPLVRKLAQATSPQQRTEWQARDRWPPRRLHRGNVVLVGDAAHPMLPTRRRGFPACAGSSR